MAFINNKSICLKSRSNKDWTNYFLPVVNALQIFTSYQLVLDGEIVVLDAHGKSNFQLLQNSIKNAEKPFIYYVFDLLYFDRYSLTSLPLVQRKEILKKLLSGQDTTIRYSDHVFGHGREIFQNACQLGLEGIISKQIDSPYVMKRSKSWLKIKCLSRQEVIIAGYTPPRGNRKHFGALLLAVFNEKGNLVYIGNVGTGFTENSLADIYFRLQKIRRSTSPFHQKIPGSTQATWVEPRLVAEVEFSEWTFDGHLRHPSFKGLRLDKKPEEVRREQAISLNEVNAMDTKRNLNQKGHFKLTHADKVLYPEDGITKEDILTYYETVCDYIMPFIKNRVLSLVRCPNTLDKCFFQRHYNRSFSEHLKPITIATQEGKEEFIYLDSAEGLFSLVQIGVLEIHPWGSLINHLDYPNIIVFDLDPAPELEWKKVVESAKEIKNYLEEFQLCSFIKTTGGKGLHIALPILPEYTWDEVKNFANVFVSFLEKKHPEKYVGNMNKMKRKGKIFVDYLRNQRGATAIAAYSTRARPHAPVSTPLSWNELSKDKRDNEYTIKNLPARLHHLKDDPWAGFWEIRQSLRLNDFKK